MVRMRFESPDEPSLRDKLFDVLENSPTSVAQDLEALLQCAAQIRNRQIVQKTAKECGFKLSRFISNNNLELYYDIKQGRHAVGYISKGWDEPGFRIGDVIIVPKAKNAVLKANAYTLLSFCATRGVVLTFNETAEGVEIHMNASIFSDGFNSKVFEQSLNYLNVCVENVEKLLA